MKAAGAAAEVQVAAHTEEHLAAVNIRAGAHTEEHPAAVNIRAGARSTAGAGNLQSTCGPKDPDAFPADTPRKPPA
jgi:hypothetical protein